MNRIQGYLFGLRHDLQFAAHVFAHKRCWRWIKSCYSSCPECERVIEKVEIAKLQIDYSYQRDPSEL